MVSMLTIVCMAISSIVVFALPIGLAVYFYKKEKISLIAILVGALVFFIFQGVIRIPLLQIMAKMDWYKQMAKSAVLISLFLGITAGIFEEGGRYLGFKFVLKNKLEWKNGVAFGIGHGGIEAALLVGLTYINDIVYSFMINSGVFDKSIGAALPKATVDLLRNSLLNTPSYMFLVGGLERIFAITIQIALSIVVMYGVMKKKLAYLLLAVLLHTVVDSPAVFMQYYNVSVWIIEAVVAVIAVAALIFIIMSRSFVDKEIDEGEQVL